MTKLLPLRWSDDKLRVPELEAVLTYCAVKFRDPISKFISRNPINIRSILFYMKIILLIVIYFLKKKKTNVKRDIDVRL